MSSSRAVLFLVSLTALAAPAFSTPVFSTPAFRHFPAATPLNEIPLYALSAAAPEALTALEDEIERLYTHAKSLPSGPERRAFETRIYQLEKRLTPLAKAFEPADWEKLRTAVKIEWQAIQNTLPTSGAVQISAPRADEPAA